VVPLEDMSFWPQVDIGVPVRAPLVKRPVGQQRKNRIKGCVEGGSGKKKVAKIKKKQRNCFDASLGAQIVASWIIGRITQNAISMEQRKGKVHVTEIITYLLK
jgi:hypothetical protein